MFISFPVLDVNFVYSGRDSDTECRDFRVTRLGGFQWSKCGDKTQDTHCRSEQREECSVFLSWLCSSDQCRRRITWIKSASVKNEVR
jgi:hypothetical protein